MSDSTRDTVIDIIARTMNVSHEIINDESSPSNIDSWDSLRHFNLVLELEDIYGIEFSEDDIVDMLNVGEIVKKVSTYV